MMIEKFINKLQMPIRETDPQFDRATLLRAIELSKELERAIFDTCKGDKTRKDKFRSMMSVLGTHPHMRKKLLLEEVTPLEIVQMKRDDFLSAELKRQRSEAEEMRMQA